MNYHSKYLKYKEKYLALKNHIGGQLSWDDLKDLKGNSATKKEVDMYGTNLHLILEENNPFIFKQIRLARDLYLPLEEKLKNLTLNMPMLERIKLKKELRVSEDSFTKINEIIGEINKIIDIKVTLDGVIIKKK